MIEFVKPKILPHLGKTPFFTAKYAILIEIQNSTPDVHQYAA